MLTGTAFRNSSTRLDLRQYRCRCLAVLIGCLAAISSVSRSTIASDWPQILGPNRNGKIADESLPDSLPESLSIRWEVEIGEGYAGVAVANGRVIAFHRQAENEVVEAFAAEDGERLWRTELPASYRGGINPDTGPRAVPVITQDRVIVWGAAGQLSCLEFATGRELWSINLFAEYRGDENYFGAGSAPIVSGETVVVNVGGRRGAGIVGVDLKSGEVRWTSTDEGTSYAAPIELEIDNQTVVVVPTRLQLIGLDARTGQETFRFPFGRTGPTVNAAVPLVDEQNRLFVTAAYEIGAKLLEITPTADGGQGVKAVWENNESISSQYFTPVLHQGFLYGTDGREDFNNTSFRCVDLETGEVQWEQAMAGAHVILVGEDLVVVSIEGDVTIARASHTGFEPRLEQRLENAASRAMPAFANGCLYTRTNAVRGVGKLRCISLVE